MQLWFILVFSIIQFMGIYSLAGEIKKFLVILGQK